MVKRRGPSLLVVGTMALGILLLPQAPRAETLAQWNMETRLTLAFRVSPAELQGRLPAPWQVAAVPSGPDKDANLFVHFISRLVIQDADGQADAGGTDRFVLLTVPATHPQTGESAVLVLRGYTPNPHSIPGPYKNDGRASVQREQLVKEGDVGAGEVSDSWEVRDAVMGVVGLDIRYRRGIPHRDRPDAKVRSAADPSILRFDRGDRGVDVVKSVPGNIDRVHSLQFRATIPELQKLFDGTEQLISVTAHPWYLRPIYLP